MSKGIIQAEGMSFFFDENGTAHFKLADVAIAFGFTDTKKGKTYIRWSRVRAYLEEIGFSPVVAKMNGDADDSFLTDAELRKMYIPEHVFYRLGMKANNPAANALQDKIATEILPAIRKHGYYISPAVADDYKLQKAISRDQYLGAYKLNMSSVKALIDYAEFEFNTPRDEIDPDWYAKINRAINDALKIIKGGRPDCPPEKDIHMKILNRELRKLIDKAIAARENPFLTMRRVLEHIKEYGRQAAADDALEAAANKPKLAAAKGKRKNSGADRTLDQPKVYTFDNHYIH